MFAKASIGSAMFLSSLTTTVTPSASYIDPTITPGPSFELYRKQNDDRFMGWESISGTWMSQQCDLGGTYFQSGGYWRCCGSASAGCDIPKACVDGNLIYPLTTLDTSNDVTRACTDVYTDLTARSLTICNTAFMYQNEQDSSPQTNIVCGASSVNWSYYRVEPEAAETISEASATRTTTAATTSESNGDTNSASPTLASKNQKKKKSNKAWISGVVVGPVIATALIGFVTRSCLRRKRRSKAAAVAPAVTNDSRP